MLSCWSLLSDVMSSSSTTRPPGLSSDAKQRLEMPLVLESLCFSIAVWQNWWEAFISAAPLWPSLARLLQQAPHLRAHTSEVFASAEKKKKKSKIGPFFLLFNRNIKPGQIKAPNWMGPEVWEVYFNQRHSTQSLCRKYAAGYVGKWLTMDLRGRNHNNPSPVTSSRWLFAVVVLPLHTSRGKKERMNIVSLPRLSEQMVFKQCHMFISFQGRK